MESCYNNSDKNDRFYFCITLWTDGGWFSAGIYSNSSCRYSTHIHIGSKEEMSWLLLSKLLPQPVFFLPLLLSSLLLPLCLAYFFPFYFTRIFFFKKGFELKESSEYVPGSYPRQRVELKNSFINHNSYFEYGTKFYLTTMAQFITWPAWRTRQTWKREETE